MSPNDIGKDPSRIDDEQPGDETVADALGFELTASDGQPDSTPHAGKEDSSMSRETDSLDDCPELTEINDLTDLIGVVRSQQQLIVRLGTWVASQQETIDELTDDVEEVSTDVEEVTNDVGDLEERVEDVEETADQSVATSKEIAATVNGALEETSTDTTESKADSESADNAGPGEASSPMDFFLNCQQYHVNQSLSANRARAVEIVHRRAEFAKRRNGDGRLFFDAEALKEALLAIAAAAVLGAVLRGTILVSPGIDIRTIPQVAERTSPNFLSLFLAFGSGIAGAISVSRGSGSTLVGVAIAVGASAAAQPQVLPESLPRLSVPERTLSIFDLIKDP